MLLGFYQCPSPAGDIPAGFDMLVAALEQAAHAGVDMLVMPELFLPGYGACLTDPDLIDETWPEQVAGLCKRAGVGLTLGLAEREHDRVFNSAFCFSARGEILARHRKLQLFGEAEQSLFAPGTAPTVFDINGTRFGVLICYDVEFPEHVRALAQLGAEVILVPTANMHPFLNVHQFLAPARAAENAVTLVCANYCGQEPGLDYTGLSMILGPDGYTLAATGQGTGLCICELPDGGWSEHAMPLATQLADLRKTGA